MMLIIYLSVLFALRIALTSLLQFQSNVCNDLLDCHCLIDSGSHPLAGYEIQYEVHRSTVRACACFATDCSLDILFLIEGLGLP